MRLLAFFLVLVTILGSCQEDENTTPKGDYSVLGLKELIVGFKAYEFDGVTLDFKKAESLSGFGSGATGMEYLCALEVNSVPSIKLISTETETMISVTDIERSHKKAVKVEISRPGFSEKVSFIMVFLNLPLQL